jgi:hypothetical protein
MAKITSSTTLHELTRAEIERQQAALRTRNDELTTMSSGRALSRRPCSTRTNLPHAPMPSDC